MRVVPGIRSLVDEDVLTGVIAINEAIAFFYVEPFNGTAHSDICRPGHVSINSSVAHRALFVLDVNHKIGWPMSISSDGINLKFPEFSV